MKTNRKPAKIYQYLDTIPMPSDRSEDYVFDLASEVREFAHTNCPNTDVWMEGDVENLKLVFGTNDSEEYLQMGSKYLSERSDGYTFICVFEHEGDPKREMKVLQTAMAIVKDLAIPCKISSAEKADALTFRRQCDRDEFLVELHSRDVGKSIVYGEPSRDDQAVMAPAPIRRLNIH